jgi:hypothetical protein
MNTRQKAVEEAKKIVEIIGHLDFSWAKRVDYIADVLEPKIKEIETLREAAGKLRYVLQMSGQHDFNCTWNADNTCCDCGLTKALKEFDKVMGGGEK